MSSQDGGSVGPGVVLSAPSGQATFSSEIPYATRYNRWVLDVFRPYIGRSVLEVGFGHSGVRSSLGSESRYVGLDLDAAVVEQAQREDPAATFVQADICAADLVTKLAAFELDTILCANVIEHLADDRLGVRNLLDALVPGGCLLLFVPALPRLYNDLDRLAGHHRRYTRRSLAALIPAEATVVRRLEYFNPVGALGWWLNNFTRHDSLQSARVGRQVRLFDRYAVPLSRAINPMTRRWLGQSVLCVAQRD